jgi:hypothetical protein
LEAESNDVLAQKARNKCCKANDGRVGSERQRERGDKAMLVEKLLLAARKKLVTIADDAR